MANDLKLVYEDISPLAKGDSTATSTDKKDFVDMSDLSSDVLTTFPEYALCLPRYSKLNGKYVNAPNTIPTSGMGYVSNSISNENGEFENNPKITITFTQKHTSVGLNLVFNTYSDDYASLVNIKWYSDDTLLSDKDFTPNSSNYSCMNNVKLFNKIIIEFKKTSKPYRYVFLGGIIYGIIRIYNRNELKRINLLAEISQISEELTINTFGFTLVSKENTQFLFQKQQKLKLYDGNGLLGAFYLDTANRLSANSYDINTYDAIGILEQTNFVGGIFNNVTASSLLELIFADSGIEYTVDEITSAKVVSGYMPIMTKREALCWVCIATGSVCDTTRSEKVDIYRLNDTVARTIGLDKQYEGTSVENTQIVTAVRVTAYGYTESTEYVQVFNEVLNGSTTIEFSEPLHSLAITGGTIASSSTNYAIITGTGSTVTLTGKKYNVSTRVVEKSNPNVGALDVKNVIELTDCTLISSSNVEEIATRVLNYYLKTKKVNAKIILGDNDLGDKVTIDTDYEGELTGTIEKLEISGNNKLAGKVVIR